MNDEAAVSALKRLGLTTYEARVFVALQKLETGTASDVADIADVPRSQVYGAAEDLEARGLVDVEQSNPTRYRPVGVEEARERLYRQLRSESDAAFDYLESVEAEYGESEESESIWTVRGPDHVAARAVELLASADERAVYGSEDVTPQIRDELAAAVDRGVDVTVLSEDEEVLAVAAECGARGVHVEHPPGLDADQIGADGDQAGQGDDQTGQDGDQAGQGGEQAGGDGDQATRTADQAVPNADQPVPDVGAERVVMVDGDTVLVSVLGDDGEETAFWSRGTGFASMLSRLLSEFTESVVPGDPGE